VGLNAFLTAATLGGVTKLNEHRGIRLGAGPLHPQRQRASKSNRIEIAWSRKLKCQERAAEASHADSIRDPGQAEDFAVQPEPIAIETFGPVPNCQPKTPHQILITRAFSRTDCPGVAGDHGTSTALS
jgi:hypothetical protein